MDSDSLVVREQAGEVRFDVLARPKSSRLALGGVRDGALVVFVHAAPDRGAANDELVRFLAEILGVSKSSLRLIFGEKSRKKSLAVRGLTAAELRARLR